MKKILVFAVGAVLLILFDRMMRLDHERLCSNDATAYDECR